MRFVLAGATTLALALAPSAVRAEPTSADGAALRVGEVLVAPRLELRARGELRRDAPDLGGAQGALPAGPVVRDALAVSGRTRAGVRTSYESLTAVVTLQDARLYGSGYPVATGLAARSAESLGLYEAYGELRTVDGERSFLRLGRQSMVWGEGRLLGRADFSPTGRSFDALRGRLALSSRVALEGLAAALSPSQPAGASFASTGGPARFGGGLFGAYASAHVARLLRFELYGLGRVTEGGGGPAVSSRFITARSDGELVTGALRAFGADGPVDYALEGVAQRGRARALAGDARVVEAWGAAGHVGYRVESLLGAPTLRVRAAYASGDDGRGRTKQLDPLFADVQTHHGLMDLFAWSNLMEGGGEIAFEPASRSELRVAYRALATARRGGEWIGSYLQPIAPLVAAPGQPPSAAADGRGLGHMVDVSWVARPWEPLEVRVGYSMLVLGRAARAAMGRAGRADVGADGMLHPAHLSHYALAQATLRLP